MIAISPETNILTHCAGNCSKNCNLLKSSELSTHRISTAALLIAVLFGATAAKLT